MRACRSFSSASSSILLLLVERGKILNLGAARGHRRPEARCWGHRRPPRCPGGALGQKHFRSGLEPQESTGGPVGRCRQAEGGGHVPQQLRGRWPSRGPRTSPCNGCEGRAGRRRSGWRCRARGAAPEIGRDRGRSGEIGEERALVARPAGVGALGPGPGLGLERCGVTNLVAGCGAARRSGL